MCDPKRFVPFWTIWAEITVAIGLRWLAGICTVILGMFPATVCLLNFKDSGSTLYVLSTLWFMKVVLSTSSKKSSLSWVRILHYIIEQYFKWLHWCHWWHAWSYQSSFHEQLWEQYDFFLQWALLLSWIEKSRLSGLHIVHFCCSRRLITIICYLVHNFSVTFWKNCLLDDILKGVQWTPSSQDPFLYL